MTQRDPEKRRASWAAYRERQKLKGIKAWSKAWAARRRERWKQWVAQGLTTKGTARLSLERQRDRLVEQNAVQALRYWLTTRATDEQVARWYAGKGTPWCNPRITKAEQWTLRYRHDPEFQLSERLKRQVRKKRAVLPHLPEEVRRGVHAGRASSKLEIILGYTMAQLRQHLERQFKRGMTWDSYSKHGWHIDHILPKKCFDLTSVEGVQAYWSLSNLRPLGAKANLTKADRVETLL